ncbi:DUF1330 domain-containing protein [Aestuariibius sp. HNIBRBA575]|uniref:DUF1330 domain-containing protein n=1 Tax=Aestuariibius sp. HNIBRBA575 TaxID=3233343 RepID=UPI0034A31FD2
MTAYAIVTLTVNDAETLAQYREKAGAALAKYDAKPLHVSPDATVIEGDITAPDVTVILTFPDRDKALGWINDPELANVHALRRGSGTSNIILM